MIAFLTLCYIAVLAILVKAKVIGLNLWWKLSPLAWMLLLIVLLFIPMQWGAPGGAVGMYQPVVEIVPNVSGQVIDVPVQPLQRLERGDVLFRIDPEPFEAQVNNIEASLKLSRINLARAQELLRKNVGPQVDVDRYTAEVDQLTAQLDKALYDLNQTVVRAPGAGYVLGVSLRAGQRVANLPLRSWMAFVNMEQSRLVMGVNQNTARFVRPGQRAEVTFKILPGKTFSATVLHAAPITPQGQLAPSGNVPLAPTRQDVPQPFGVILELQETFEEAGLLPVDVSAVPGGAIGTGAIYTESAKLTHIIRKVILRMQAWINYINPY